VGRTVDDKIVNISIDFKKFGDGVRKVTQDADKLNKSLKFPNAGKGLEDVGKAAKNVDLTKVISGIDGISGKLNALRLIAINTFSNLASSAIRSGARFAKSFTLGPIIAGFQEYSTNLNAVQTILANTQASGATLKDVNAALLQLNKYSDKTIYNFSEMAKNIGTFTAAGVDLDTSVQSIKGIANLAALSGSSAEQASTAMYQLSQAIASGRVSLQDWRSVVNAGIGGTVFQRALAQTAVKMGTIKDSAVKLSGPMKNVAINGEPFFKSIAATTGKPSWLTSDVLTKTLTQFTGDLTNAQLAAQGFNQEQIRAIQQTAKSAELAATQVKTITQVLDVAKETAGSGWSQSFQILFGNFGEAKVLFTAVSNAVNGFINANAKARNKVLGDWKALGGRTILIKAIKDVFQDLGAILKPIKLAFRDIFPKHSAHDLLQLTKRFKELADRMRPSAKTADDIRHTFHGLFAAIDIGRQIVSGILSMFKSLFVTLGAGSGGFLSFTAGVGDFIVKLDEALKKGNVFHNFFVKMGAVLGAPLKALLRLKDAIGNLFSGFSSAGISKGVSGLTHALTPLQKLLGLIAKAWTTMLSAAHGSLTFIQPLVDQIVVQFQQLGPAIADAIKHMNVEAILQVIRTTLLGGIFLLFRNFFRTGGKLFHLQSRVTIFSLMFRNVGYGIDALTGTLKTMQTNIQSKTLKNIAISVALLALSVVALSLADPKRVNSALASMAFLLIGLIKSMQALSNVGTGKFGAANLAILGTAMIELGLAINLITLSVIALSRLNVDQLKKGLGGLTAIMVVMTATAQKLGESAPGMIRAGIGITAMAVGLNILVPVIKNLGAMKVGDLAKGLGAIGLGLTLIADAMQGMPKTLIFTATGVGIMAFALLELSKAVRAFGAMNLKTMGKGLLAISIGLDLIGLSMHAMPLTLPITAAGLVLVSFALQGIAKTIAVFGTMKWDVMKKGIIGLGGSLVLLSVGLAAMSGSAGGALALVIAATGINLFVPALILLGHQSKKTLITGLTALAGAMTAIGLAGELLTPAVPALLGFGASLLLIGGGIALAGAGIALIGVGLGAIAVSGPAAIAIIMKSISDFVDAFVEMGKNAVLGLVEIVKAFAETAPQLVTALVKIIGTLLDVIIRLTPKFVKVAEVLIGALLKVLHDKGPDIIHTGLELLLSLLKGIRDNISELVTVAGAIIVNFLKGLASQAKNIIAAGFDIIVSIIAGIIKGLVRMVDAGARGIVTFLNGIAKAIRKYEPQIIKAGFKIGLAIIQGMIDGLTQFLPKLKDTVVHMAKKVIGWAKGIFRSHSPSLEFTDIGKDIGKGLGNGISNSKDPKKATEDMSKGVIDVSKSTFGITAGGSTVMADIGQQVATGFAKGVHGGASDIKGAFKDLNDRLFTAASDARRTLAEEQKKLDDLMKHPKKNADAIKEAQKIIKENQDILARSVAGHEALTKTLRSEKDELERTSNEYAKVSAKLKTASQDLADAKQARDDAFDTVKGQFGALPDIVYTDADGKKINALKTYTDGLINQTNAVAKYRDTLARLRKLGLDDQTYQKLLDDGTADQQFADQLLKGGAAAVRGIDYLDGQLTIAAGTLADNASKSLYGVGVNIAQGIVNGLKDKQDELKKAGHIIADTIVSTVKTALKIKSPSEVFAEIGAFTTAGMAKGLIESSKAVTDAVYMVSDDAMGAMKESMTKVSDLVAGQIDPNPTITPVLDLTDVKMGAKTLGSLLNDTSLVPAATLNQARTISSGGVFQQQFETAPVTPNTTEIKIEQNNTSPKALDEVEIYRQTRNLISQLRSRPGGVILDTTS
jgi:tape measure domain-containing protein